MRKHKKLLMSIIPIVIIVVVTIGLSEMFYKIMVGRITDDCWNTMKTAHREVSDDIDMHLSSELRTLDIAAGAVDINVDMSNKESVLEYLNNLQKETIFNRVDMIFPDGSVLVQNGDIISDMGDTAFEELVAGGSRISQRFVDYFDREQEVIHFFSPVYDENNNPVALLSATAYCSSFNSFFKSSVYGENARLFLIDMRDGNVVSDMPDINFDNIYDMMNLQGYELSWQSSVENPLEDLLDGNSGTMSYSHMEGETTYTYYAPVNEDFSLVMSVSGDVVFASVNETRDMLMVVGAVEALLLLLFTAWIYKINKKSMAYEKRAGEAELELLRKKERELQNQYDMAVNQQEFLETMAVNLPGGYHRCTADYAFEVTFVSKSFTRVTGYTLEDIKKELNGSYIGLIYPEDKPNFKIWAEILTRDGYVNCAYRIRRKDGEIRWVMDAIQFVEHENGQYFQCAFMDITEHIDEINKAKQAAEASSQAKSTFLFNISHDIRTPMNAIKGFSRIIRENSQNTQLVMETIDKIDQASESLMMLMNDVLDISRIERGKEELNLKIVDLYEHNKNLYEMFASDMHSAGINFETAGDKINDHIYCDELKLTRIIMNMLSNAKKFTKSGGTVTFGTTKLAEDEKTCTYKFFVRDTGIGMSPEFLKKAFEQFERERTSTESGIVGSGLGLAIIKMLVELMGGTVEIQSELGKGTEITATITFMLADSDDLTDTVHQEQVAVDMRGKRVLLVEDNDFNREIAGYILDSMGIIVDEAENGAVCIEKVMAAAPDYYDLILMDIQMPIMDGYTATVELRNLADKQKASVPIVAMTANAFDEDKKKCLDIGMNGHISKPLEMNNLIKELSGIWE